MDDDIKRIGDIRSTKGLFGENNPPLQKNGRPMTERQGLVKYFFDKLSPHWDKGKLTASLVSMKVNHLKLKDLYFLKSICDKAELEGRSEWSKVFFGSLKIK